MTYPYRNEDFLNFMLIAQGEQRSLSEQQLQEAEHALAEATDKQNEYLDLAQIYYQQAEQGILNPRADRNERKLELATEARNRYEQMVEEYTWNHRVDDVWYRRLQHVIVSMPAFSSRVGTQNRQWYNEMPLALLIRIVFSYEYGINMSLARVSMLFHKAEDMVRDVIENGIIH